MKQSVAKIEYGPSSATAVHLRPCKAMQNASSKAGDEKRELRRKPRNLVVVTRRPVVVPTLVSVDGDSKAIPTDFISSSATKRNLRHPQGSRCIIRPLWR